LSQYRLVSNFRVTELLVAVGFIALLTWFGLQEYRNYYKNSFAANFVMYIQNAKTDTAIETAFKGINETSEYKIVHSKLGDGSTPFKYLSVDNRGEIKLITPDKSSDYWYPEPIIDDFADRQMSMYIHKTGTSAYSFSYLSCEPNPEKSYTKNQTNGVKKMNKKFYQLYCQ
jgi:Tfp pilus assembly major pilin PilA